MLFIMVCLLYYGVLMDTTLKNSTTADCNLIDDGKFSFEIVFERQFWVENYFLKPKGCLL